VELWLALALLETFDAAKKIIERGIQALQRKGVEINRDAWMKEAEAANRAGSLEKAHGTRESLDVLLGKAVSYTPQAEVLWRMDAKEKWLAGDVLGGERVWMKYAIVERELENTEEERRLLNEGLELFPLFFKLRLMFGQLEERLGRLPQAK
ncbi:protein stabilized1, partial [Tanacetum coccineum]